MNAEQIEQIIKQSTVTGIVLESLNKSFKKNPHYNIEGMRTQLARMIIPDYETQSVETPHLVKSVFGYVGKDEYSDAPNILWKREFHEPLSIYENSGFVRVSDKVFGLRLDNQLEIRFLIADGLYLGCH